MHIILAQIGLDFNFKAKCKANKTVTVKYNSR